MELTEKALNYAEGKVNEVMTKAIAKAYAEGYRDGYKDREDEIPIDLRDNKTEYVDLGLPSGTLWAKEYETKDDNYIYVPYEKAVTYDIPTKEQWDELYQECKWEYVPYAGGKLFRIDCIGPNGKIISFRMTGKIKAILKGEKTNAYFWIREETDNDEKSSVHIGGSCIQSNGKTYYFHQEALKKSFSGYGLPIRLVRKK